MYRESTSNIINPAIVVESDALLWLQLQSRLLYCHQQRKVLRRLSNLSDRPQRKLPV